MDNPVLVPARKPALGKVIYAKKKEKKRKGREKKGKPFRLPSHPLGEACRCENMGDFGESLRNDPNPDRLGLLGRCQIINHGKILGPVIWFVSAISETLTVQKQ
jgi:hypothetical protein